MCLELIPVHVVGVLVPAPCIRLPGVALAVGDLKFTVAKGMCWRGCSSSGLQENIFPSQIL